MIKPAQFGLLFLLGSVASLVQAQACGREGQQPCADGCEANALPKPGEVAEWYPGADNYVPAPKGFRQTEGLCTRCGNIYEPVCMVDGNPRCFIDAHAGVIMEPTEDGYCVPPQKQFGCGTTGLPPCPEKIVQEYGTLAVLSKRGDNDGWQLTASLGEVKDDGCLYSSHNLVLRFVKAPEAWLPEGHKCADVCIACGIPGHPACEIVGQPPCMRRHSEDDMDKYRDGPTYVDKEGMCRALHCGGETIDSKLPPCTDQLGISVLAKIDTSEGVLPGYDKKLDADADGCAEPFVNTNGVCEDKGAGGGSPVINLREFDCSREGVMLIDENVITTVRSIIAKASADANEQRNVKGRLTPLLNNKGKCVECGRGGDLPCSGMDFDGCMVAEGFMLDQDIGLCVAAPCGGSNVGLKSPAWNDTNCAVEKPPWYKDTPEESPINEVTNCLYFHNLVKDEDGNQHCEPCGTPGNKCVDECIMGLVFQPLGTSEQGLGEFQFLDDSIRTSGPLEGHCTRFPEVKLYDDTCASPKRVSDTDNFPDLPPARIYSPQASSRSEDPGFGTADNPDDCLHPVQTVDRVYEDQCPGTGGTPVSKYGQCGGQDYNGPTCCFGYSVCVQKSEFYSLCEGANVPSEFIPWHSDCGGENMGTCEAGSTCEKTGDSMYCKPALHHIPHSGGSSKKGTARRAFIGVALSLVALLVAAMACAFVFGRRRGAQKGQFKFSGSGWGDAETYASGSQSAAEGKAGQPLAEGSTTYLDLAAATEAEALQQRRSHKDEQDAQLPSLPTSDFGIGRRA